MKKSLLLSISGITLIALTATTLYAQTVAGSSIVDKMKAAMRPSFTLSANLNPGQTGFDSAPVSGKKTGNMLTAGEWNRILELISEGGGGNSGCAPSSSDVYDSGWVDFQGKPVQTFTHNLGTMDTVVFMEMKSDKDYTIAHTVPVTLKPGKTHAAYSFMYTKWYNKTENTIDVTTANNIETMSDRYVRIVMAKISAIAGGCGGTSAGGGDKFTFLDTDILLHNSGVTKIDKTTPVALDLSTVSGITLPSGIKAVQLHVICNNYTTQNEAVSLNVGRSPTAMLRVCQQNVMGAANDVDTNTVYIPIADDKKTLYYSYQVPSTETGGQVVISLRGFITE